MTLQWMDEALREPYKAGIVTTPGEHAHCDHKKVPVGVLERIDSRGAAHKADLVDEEIAPLIYHLWKTGVAVRSSCQDHEVAPDSIFLDFISAQDFELFLDLCVGEELADRTFYSDTKRWFISCNPCQHGDELGLALSWKAELSVWLPREDLPDLLVKPTRAA